MALRAALVVTLATAAGFAPAAAQRQPLPPPGGLGAADADTSRPYDAELEGLLRLPGVEVDVRYPPDHLDRAARLQMRLAGMVQSWQPLTRRRLAWSAAVVDSARWRRLAPEAPWGWPLRLAGPLFLVPAQGDAATVALVSSLLGGPPPDPGGEPMIGSREEAGSILVIDLLTQLEAARELADAARWRGDEPWIHELAVHLALRYAWELREPSEVLTRVRLFDRIAAAQGGPAARRLADFRPGLDRATDLWFQAQFVRGADTIWVDKGRFGVSRLLDRWADGGKPKRRAELEKRYPALVDWQRSAFAP